MGFAGRYGDENANLPRLSIKAGNRPLIIFQLVKEGLNTRSLLQYLQKATFGNSFVGSTGCSSEGLRHRKIQSGDYLIYVMVEDCYFFVDQKVPLNERKMSVLCTECHDTKMPDVGMFYHGSKEGYGPFEFKCCVCRKIIQTEEKETGF
jgi:hypothetical protein